MSTRLHRGPMRDKTASFTLDPVGTRCGTVFTNRGATGAVVLTLPQLAPNATWDGYWIEFVGVADQSITVTAAANKAITFNNAAATSLAASTGGQKIGARIRAMWDASGSMWQLDGVAVGATYTVA